ncbi:MAG: TraR/DksA family transcriptional regulator [Deltaproteobacteria bacterium]|nr:TraR/DksA family transcriptional regulator [Deltaproteobacteria bacterium]
MRKRELDKFKKLLVLEQQKILQHLSSLEGASESELSQTNTGDPVDLASVEINQASIQKLGNREKKLLSKIQYALEKIENGEYGTCESCGEQISAGRLEARPVAQYCIDCKTEMEQNERRYTDDDGKEDEDWPNDDYDDAS